MIAAKSMDVRDNFKSWCGQVADGEIVQIARPGKSYVYLINQENYERLTMERRISAYTTYMFGKDKITNLKRLSEIEKLPDNWNNNGAAKISTNIIRTVRKLLLKIDIQPEVFPTACDALQLEWENDLGEYLEMEVLEDSINIFQIDLDGNEYQRIIELNESLVEKVVRDFYDRTV